MLHRRLLPVLGAAAVLLPAAGAEAADLCVQPAASCAAEATYADVQLALDAAATAPGADRVLLGAATYTAPAGGYDYGAADPIELAGAGQGQTTLTGPAGASRLLRVFGPAQGSAIHDLTVDVPAGMTGLNAVIARGQLERLTITTAAAGQAVNGLSLRGGTLADSTVDLPQQTGSGFGVWIEDEQGTVRDVTVRGRNAVGAQPGEELVVEGARLRASSAGVLTYGGKVTVRNTLIETTWTGSGMSAYTQSGHDGTIVGDHVTIVGDPNQGTAVGASGWMGAGGERATVELRNSIIRGFLRSVYRNADMVGVAADVTFDHVDHDDKAARIYQNGDGTFTDTHHTWTPAAGFVAADDFHLTAQSPLVDAGAPGTAGDTDLDGRPRALDGNGDCDARPDLGAFETVIDHVTAKAAATPKPAGTASTFSAAGSCVANPASTATYTWAFDDGAAATGAEAEHVFTTPGAHSATLTMSDGKGQTDTATVTFDVPAAPKAPDTGGTDTGTGTGGTTSVPEPPAVVPAVEPRGVTPPAADTVAPKLGRITLQRRSGGRVQVRFALGEAATVTVKVGGRAKKVRLRAGKAAVTLRARAGRVTVTAVDAAGNRATRRGARLAPKR